MFGLLSQENVLIQKQPNTSPGFIEIPDDVVCGMIYDPLSETWSNPEPSPPTVAQVNAHAELRITTFCPLWKQSNLQARSLELLEKKTGILGLTPAEEDEADAIKDVFNHINALREDSDVLTAMDPIPFDYEDDSHWTTTPVIDLGDKF